MRDGLLYIGESDAHNLDIFDASTGELKRRVHLGNAIYNAPVFTGDYIIALTGNEKYPIQIPGNGKFFVLDPEGNAIKNMPLSGSVFNTPVHIKGKVYYGSCDGRIYRLNLDNFLSEE